jgi:hypothetical protein
MSEEKKQILSPTILIWNDAIVTQIKDKPMSIHNESSSRLKRYYLNEFQKGNSKTKAPPANSIIFEADPTKILPTQVGQHLSLCIQFGIMPIWQNPYHVTPVLPEEQEELIMQHLQPDKIDTAFYGKYIRTVDVETNAAQQGKKQTIKMYYFDFGIITSDPTKPCFVQTDEQLAKNKLLYNGSVSFFLQWK